MLSLVVTTLVLTAVYWLTVSERDQQLERNVLLAADTFSRLSASGSDGGAALRRVVDAHARGAANTLLALETDTGMAGNLSEFPGQLPRYPDTGRFPVAVSNLSGDASVEMARGTWIDVEGRRLMVAQLEADAGEYRRNFLLASMLALVMALLLTLMAGYLFNRRQVRRLRSLSEGIEKIQRGRMEIRLPSREDGDELDVLASQVNQMLDEIDELLHSVAGVTDNIAHDLRTPLSRLRLRLDEIGNGLGRSSGGTAGLEKTLGDAQADLDQLLETFEAMLELARLEQGALQLDGKSCDLAAIASDVFELLAPVAEERGQQLALQCEDAGAVKGDTSLLFRALYNLVDNAIQHAGEGARITLRQRGTCIAVEDNGPGIPPAERERVFRRLYRLDQSRNRPGTGLGLSVVRAIARLHGATIALADANPGLSVTLDFASQETV
ncbi:HAMP domain-containing histidine kinase [Parahaliea aestuarii]